jgi:transketolase
MAIETRTLANAVRALAMDAVEAANSGHPGMPMGMADAATVLWTEYLRHDPADPSWPDRDRFVLSAGHGSMLLYALLHLTGYERPTIEDIKGFRKLGSPCAGHPENFLLDGVEATTGPLGQGLAMAVGMAIAERHLNAEYGGGLVDHRTWVIAGDGCLMEGVNHEAAGLAGHLGLGRLIVFWDDNKITIDGATDLSTSEDIEGRYAAYGWHVARCDGLDAADVRRAIDEALADPRPSLIACRTIIGFGAPNKQGSAATHGAALGPDEVAAARATLGWDHPPFEIPADLLASWREAGKGRQAAHRDWRARLDGSDRKAEFLRRMAGDLPADFSLQDYVQGLIADPQKVATRKASEMALEAINAQLSETIGGSADLTGSNNTKTKGQKPLTKEDYSGRYLYYGIREFGMAAAMNGMALHGGVIPYGGTFLVFADYARPAIRLSALQQVRVIYVMTHDSIGLGEDGPTHQPVEHLAALRAIPGLQVMRPADTIETAECWQLALESKKTPTVIALTRQNLPTIRDAGDSNLCARGAYILAGDASAPVRLIASGSETHLALGARDLLAKDGIQAAVVSMPSWELFAAQDETYHQQVLGADGTVRVACEAASGFGWERWLGSRGAFVGMKSFGASAKAGDLYKHFGITAEAIAEAARRLGR